MKRIVLAFLMIALLITAVGCSSQSAQNNDQKENSDDMGYINDIDQEFDNSEIDSIDNDLNLDWI